MATSNANGPAWDAGVVRATGSTALAIEVNALTARLTALEALARAALAECEKWRVRESEPAYDMELNHLRWNEILAAQAATDAARKECGL